MLSMGFRGSTALLTPSYPTFGLQSSRKQGHLEERTAVLGVKDLESNILTSSSSWSLCFLLYEMEPTLVTPPSEKGR